MTSIETIKTLYEAFKLKDYTLFRSLCDADIEWIQTKGFPNGRHHRGADAVIQNVFEKFKDDWEYFKFEVEDMFESRDGSKVTVVGAYVGKHQMTAKEVEAATVHLLTIENHKVKTFRQFTDTAVIIAAMQP